MGGFGGRVSQIAEQMHVVERGKRLRQVLVDELHRAAQRFKPDLYEDARRIFDVVARRLHQARRLAQLRQHAASPLLNWRGRKHHLPREAGAQRVGIQLWVPFPRPDVFELEHARLNVGRHHRLLGPLDRRQIVRIDLLQPAREP